MLGAHHRLGDAARAIGQRRCRSAGIARRWTTRRGMAACLRRARARSVPRSSHQNAARRRVQPFGVAAQPSPARVSPSAGQFGGVVLGGVDVALHFAERDRALGQRAVVVEHRVVRVLPALAARAAVGRARVLDEAIAVGVAVAIDPGERRVDVRPEPSIVADRRFGRSSGRRAARTAAWHRRCRSSGRTESPRARPSRRRAPRAESCPAGRRGRDRSRWPAWLPVPAARRAPATGRPTARRAR